MGLLFAVVACVAYSIVPILASRALQRRSVLTGAALSATTSFAVLLLWTAAAGDLLAADRSTWWFVAGGVLAPGLFRLLFYRSLQTAPVGLATVMVSSYPVLAVLGAVLLQGERLQALRWLGVVLATAGVISLANPARRASPTGRGLALAVALPLTAALVRAVSELMRREGALAAASTLNGTLAMNAAALAVLVPASFAGLRLRQRYTALPMDHVPGPDLSPSRFSGAPMLILEGLLTSVAWMSSNLALASAPVSTVTPVVGIAPALTVLIAHLIKKDGERLTARVILGTSLAVGGAAMVSALR